MLFQSSAITNLILSGSLMPMHGLKAIKHALVPSAKGRTADDLGGGASAFPGRLIKPPTPNSFIPKTKPPPKAGVPKTQRECDLVSTP